MKSAIQNHELTFQIRPMEPGDIERVCELEREIFDDPWHKDEFVKSLPDPAAIDLIALSDSEITGYTCLLVTEDHVHLTNIAVAPLWRRKSVANRLMERIFEIVRKSDHDNLLLEVRPSSIEAVRLYEKFGFKELLRRKNYYRRPVEEAIVMVAYPNDSEARA